MRRLRGKRFAFVALVAGMALISAGCLQMTVSKQVVGGTWAFPFTVHVACSTPDGPVEQDLVFDGGNIGQAQLAKPIPLGDGGQTCTLTEPQSGGASTVSIVCDNPPVGVICTSAPGSLSITAQQSNDPVFVNVIVTNCTGQNFSIASLSRKRPLGFPAFSSCDCSFTLTSIKAGPSPCFLPV